MQSGPDRKGEHPAAIAARKGRGYLDAGNHPSAVEWLDRAARLAPDDPFVRLSLAIALVGQDDDRARNLFEDLARFAPIKEASLGLGMIHLRQGRPKEAGTALGAMLGRFATRDADIAQLAGQIAAALGLPGWASADSEGRVRVQLLPGWAGPPAGMVGSCEMRFQQVEAGLPMVWEGSAQADLREGQVIITAAGVPLLGSPLNLGALRRVEGVVIACDGGMRGWVRYPADFAKKPSVHVAPASDPSRSALSFEPFGLDVTESAEVALDGPRWAFVIPRSAIPWRGNLRVTDWGGRDLLGSPIDPTLEERLAAKAAERMGAALARKQGKRMTPDADPIRPLPALNFVPPREKRKPRRAPGIAIIIPVYRGAADFRACFASLRLDLPAYARIIIVEDGSPDAALRAEVTGVEGLDRVEVIRHPVNLGFPSAINTGLRAAKNDDVVILNSDTVLPAGWLGRLHGVAYSSHDIGSVTPFTNDGSIASYPDPAGSKPPADSAGLQAIDAAIRAGNGDAAVDIPTGVGFCMFLRHDCLAETGPFRDDVFAQGYGEENDWCMRARRLGWRHVLAAGVFVAHVGGRSFGSAKAVLMRRNGVILEALHPGYETLVKRFHEEDSLAAPRRAADLARWRVARGTMGAVVMVSHGRGGGVDRHLAERCAMLRATGLRPIILRPWDEGAGCRLSEGLEDGYPNLRFELPDEMDMLLATLRDDRVRRVEIHHLLGHGAEMQGLARHLGAPVHVVVHDYSWICPRIALLGRQGRYCGEPDTAECAACVADLGSEMAEQSVDRLRAGSAELFSQAALITAPTRDVAERLVRHFGPQPRLRVSAWEGPSGRTVQPTGQMAGGREAVIAVLGAIGQEKGYDLLLACARDAAGRNLPLRFVVVGRTQDDARLLSTQRVFITGEFEESEAGGLLRRHAPTAGFVPSVVPETWCYALSELLNAGLPVAALQLGAQAERLVAVPGSLLLSTDSKAPAVNDDLLAWLGVRSNL
ncbi:MAG: glycosyltransferase [Roseomonas sp.]|nr:glycosyltransferase [Roseomonas sp.]MCA3315383.1 glycosyltransferase [Roseomonas sp.]MCA3343622.1 glycosyltransferase [Roseomonas sp.]MCA3586043.1 glycosyltransferase [Methylocystis sp.]MCA3653296.1 glycosyltransferase [Methylobacterium sp.]